MRTAIFNILSILCLAHVSLFGAEVGDTVVVKRQSAVISFNAAGVSENVVVVDMRGNKLSGILMIKKTEGGMVGTLVNEFGIKAFDFELNSAVKSRLGSGKSVKLIDVVKFMDRWYIRRVLRRDIDYMLGFPNVPQNCGFEVVKEGGNIVVKDLKYRINYTFVKR